MDLSKFMMELDIWYYLVLSDMMKFMIGLNISYVKKGVLHILLVTILQKRK